MKIRIEPMNENNETFKEMNVKQIQIEYFMKYLPYKEIGWYWYENLGLTAEQDDLILFQMNNTIIASAKYDMKLEKSKAFKVKTNTIKIFKPITKDELCNIIPKFTNFSMVRWSYDKSDVDMEVLEQRMSVPIDN